jgi:hypothetical protein
LHAGHESAVQIILAENLVELFRRHKGSLGKWGGKKSILVEIGGF